MKQDQLHHPAQKVQQYMWDRGWGEEKARTRVWHGSRDAMAWEIGLNARQLQEALEELCDNHLIVPLGNELFDETHEGYEVTR